MTNLDKELEKIIPRHHAAKACPHKGNCLNLDEAVSLIKSTILKELVDSMPRKEERFVIVPKHLERYENTKGYLKEEGKDAAYLAFGDGYNQALDDCLDNIRKVLE